jgi:hypothetical protein
MKVSDYIPQPSNTTTTTNTTTPANDPRHHPRPPTPHPPINELILPHDHAPCHITAILSKTPTHYIYAISFAPDARRKTWTAHIKITHDRVDAPMQHRWAAFTHHHRHHHHQQKPTGPGLRIDQTDPTTTRGQAQIGAVLRESRRGGGEGEAVYVRDLEVRFAGRTYEGEVRVPKGELDEEVMRARGEWENSARWERDEREAVPSTEEEGEGEKGPPGRYSVEFRTFPGFGRRAQVAVWDVRGEWFFEGMALVVGLVKTGETRFVAIMVTDVKGSHWFEGELTAGLKHGRFEKTGAPPKGERA